MLVVRVDFLASDTNVLCATTLTFVLTVTRQERQARAGTPPSIPCSASSQEWTLVGLPWVPEI